MNQEKIGRFIAESIKQNKLTQEQLAEKLGITKNAVSKWERGLSLMDLSILKPLSQFLKVSIVEILNGEKLDKDKISTKNEEVLIDTLEYSSKEIKKLKKNKLLVILLTILITIILIILINTLKAIIFKNSPIISWRVADKNDSDSYIDKGILINTYYCVKEEDIVTVIPTSKNTNYNCPQE